MTEILRHIDLARPQPIKTPRPFVRPVPIRNPGPGCVLYLTWDSPGAGGVWRDRSGYGNHGTINGATWTDTPWGRGLLFDGVDDWVDCGDDFTSITTEFTIELWMETSDTSNNGTPLSYATTHSDNEILLYDYMDFNLYISSLSVPTGVSANDGNWHHIVWTWRSSDGTTKLYKDSVEVFSGTLQANYTINHGTDRRMILGQEQDTVGGGFGTSQAFKGFIALVRIYNRALSSAEIQQHYWEETPYA